MKVILKTAVVVCSLAFGASGAFAAIPSTIPVCDDQDTWPPFLQYRIVDGKRTADLEGYSLDIAQAVLGRRSIQMDIEMLPWKRCLQGAENGNHALVLNAMATPDRAKMYLQSRPFYSLTGIYIHLSKAIHPKISKPADLANYRVCGLFGYDYQPFGLRQDQVDQGAQNFEQAVEKLIYKRCDLLIGHYEVMAHRSKASPLQVFQSKEFTFAKIPQLPPVTFVMLVSRKTPYADELLDVMNKGILQMQTSAEGKRLRKKWNVEWK